VYRVVIKRINHRGIRVVELGPWHVARADAELWADMLGECGYHTEVESQRGGWQPHEQDNELADALSSMA